MKNILCKLATSVVFIIQITNINLGYSSAQVYYGDNYSNYEREYKALENNDFVNNIDMYSNNTRLHFDEQYQSNIMQYIEKDMLNNDSEIIVSKSKNIMDIINANNNTLQLNDISTNINEYISGSGGSDGGDEEQSKLIQASSIKNKCGASGSCADSNTKTCCDSFKNIYNKLTSCFVASGNINEYDEYTYAPVPKINDSELTPQDELNNHELKIQEELTMVIKDSKIRIQKGLEEFSKKMMEDTQRSIQNEFAKYYKIDESSSTTRTCYDFFKNTFNKLKSYIMPSPNNKNTDSQVDEEENSLMLQDDDINENNTNLQMNRNNEIELTPQGEDLQISQTNEITLAAQGELKKIDTNALYIPVTPGN